MVIPALTELRETPTGRIWITTSALVLCPQLAICLPKISMSMWNSASTAPWQTSSPIGSTRASGSARLRLRAFSPC